MLIKGNSIELVQFRVKTDEVLPTHLEKAPGNAVHNSKTIENYMISI